MIDAAEIPQNDVWPRPVIVPVPANVAGVENPVISLHGTWKVTGDAPAEFWSNDVDPSSWSDVPVPSQANRHVAGLGGRGRRGGAAAEEDRPDYVYKTRLRVPADFAGRRILLRFAGVTGTSTVWVNGNEVAEHHGGFTPWNPDVTEHVTPGQDAWLTVAIREPQSGQSTNTYNGGIIRDVKLLAVPEDHFTRLNLETDLDQDYRDATLKVWVGARLASDAEVRLTLLGADGGAVALNPSTIELTADTAERIVEIPVVDPLKWDAEHPNLYELQATLVVGGEEVETIRKNVGFREVEIDGVRLLVNGREVKLRGSGQFDFDPVHGHHLPDERAIADVMLYKEMNHNFVRPACYPATDAFLDACDRIGMYVEGEMPVTFAADAARNEELTPIFLSQAAETVENNRSHPSIIMWDLANETGYGVNIKKMSEYVHAEDQSRPVVYSWSHAVSPGDPLPYEIYSYHYPDWRADLGKPGVAVFNNGGRGLTIEVPPMPVLHDEIAHPSSYNNDEMRRDPNVRNFWGEGMKIFWEKIFQTEGALGAAIWAGIDYNRFPWGALDIWRRKKPEYWLLKKAYSPVRIDDQPVANPGAGQPLSLPVKNWFDHSNLSEVTFTWAVGTETGSMAGPDVPPHAEGSLQIPGRNWQRGDVLNIKAHTPDGIMVDEYNVAVDPEPVSFPGPQGPAPRIEEGADQFTVAGSDFAIMFDKQTGQITSGTFKGTELLQGGPQLHIIGADLSNWSLSQIAARTDGDEAVVDIQGTYQAVPEQATGRGRRGGRRGRRGGAEAPPTTPVTVDATFQVRIDGQGLITTRYTIDRFPLEPPATRLTPWNNTNAGGYEEVGIGYLLTGQIESLTWRRKGLWSAYPEDHIGRNEGRAMQTGPGAAAEPGTQPTWHWSLDEDSGGRATNDFRSQKESIYFAKATVAGSDAGVRAESDGTDAVRLEVEDGQAGNEVWMFINNLWNYRQLGLGNYMKEPQVVEDGYSNQVRMRLTDAAAQDR